MFSALLDVANAQPAGRPPPVDPLQVEKRLDAIESEQRRARKPPPAIPTLAQPDLKGARIPLFKLASVSIEGAKTISPTLLAEEYKPYLGRDVSQYDLEVISSRISDAYRQAGYHLSRAIIPPQDVQSGHLTVRVIEGAITALQITGRDWQRFGIGALLNPILNERPSRLSTVERQLLLASDVPGVRIADIALEEIGSATGEFRLIVKVETWSIYVGFAADNLGTFAVGPWQAYTAASFNSYVAPGDMLGINLSTVPDAIDDLRYGRVAYDVPVGNGFRLGVSASHSSVKPDDSRRLLDTRILTEIYELRAGFTAIATREHSLSFAAALGFIDNSEKTFEGTTYSDRVRIVSLMANYKFHDYLDGWNFAAVVLRQGFDGLGASHSDDPLLSREGANPNFSAFTYSYTRYQPLAQGWSIKASVVGQFASGPLLTSQAFYLGSAAFGPGYYSADNGVVGTAELRFDQSLDGFVRSYQLYSFIDGGVVWNVHDARQSLASAGFGARFQLPHDLQTGIAFAVPVSYTSRTEEFRRYRILVTISRALKLCPERAWAHCS